MVRIWTRCKGCNLCKQTGWIEILGAGIVHPNVLKMNGYVESSPRTLYWDMFTTVCEVKITVDSVPVDVIIISPSSIRLAERITVYGYPCGILYGGFSKYLQIVGIKK